ncbi:hypothetical protein AB0E21_19410 [Streptomyces sp. NPDC047967]|uniref:hypothetical protein n=1 Tax=Streptomyces sp. NPDC047967 TaxID=3154924 RepID=UPI0033E9B215
MPEKQPDTTLSLGLSWRNGEQAARPANQFIVSVGLPTSQGRPDEIYLTFGQVEPPVLTGTPEQMEDQLRKLGSLHVETLGRYVVSRDRLQELIEVLQRTAELYDSARGAVDDTGSDAGSHSY